MGIQQTIFMTPSQLKQLLKEKNKLIRALRKEIKGLCPYCNENNKNKNPRHRH
jgi:hypothetical protein|tara:strand:- start:827 stop:985 length:159 start_codon:yes stop_codon:yes gene_type:complete